MYNSTLTDILARQILFFILEGWFLNDKKSWIIHEIQVSQQKNNEVKEMKMKNSENLIRKKPKTCDYSCVC
jgi:hypothetical protein